MTNKRGGDSAFPNTYDADRFRGLTYRQYLAAEIAGHMAASHEFTSSVADNVKERTGNYDECLKMYGLSVWMLADAILEAEHHEP